MKKTILSLLFLFSVIMTYCQINSGTIKYKTEFKINWHSMCQGDPACMARMESMPNSSIAFWKLDFNENASLYTKIDSIADIENVKKMWDLGIDPNNFDPNKTVYIDNINNWVNTYSPYFNLYVIDTLKALNVKIGTEYRDILGYKCLQATIGKSCEFWFSPELSLPYGPSEHFGLPGIILELRCNAQGVYTVISAYNIQLDGDKKFNKPNGKYITKKEYEKTIQDMKN